MMKVLFIVLFLTTAVVADAQTMLELHKKIFNEILEAEIKYPLIVFKQAIHESGNFKSKATKRRNNIFGWDNGRRQFDSIAECILFYKTWQDKYYKGGDYYKFLKKIGYAKDKAYRSKVANTPVKNEIKDMLEQAKEDDDFYKE